MFTEVTMRRYAAGTYTNGRWVPGAVTEIPIVASVQPAKSDELLRLPEGMRTKGVVKAYTDSELQPGDEGQRSQPDRIVWDGEEWEVQVVDRHQLGIAHYKAICVRVER